MKKKLKLNEEEETRRELEALRTQLNLKRVSKKHYNYDYRIRVLEAKLEGHKQERERITDIIITSSGKISKKELLSKINKFK
jgi:hypothetical protein